MNIQRYLTSMVESKITSGVSKIVSDSFMSTITNPDVAFIYGLLMYLCTYTPNYMMKAYPEVYKNIKEAIKNSYKSEYEVRASVIANLREGWNKSIPSKMTVFVHGTLISANVEVPQNRNNDCSVVNVEINFVGPFHMSVVDDIQKLGAWVDELSDARPIGNTYENGTTTISMCTASKSNDLPNFYCRRRGESKDVICKSMEAIYFNGKETLSESLDKFLKNYTRYASSGVRNSYGLLLYGDPGTGKSTIAYGIAARYNMPLVKISWGGLSVDELENLVRACCSTRGVVLFDDCDSMMSVKDANGNLIYRDILLKTLDGVYCDGINPVIFVLTTNFIEKIDDAIKRPGRIDLNLHVGNIYREDAERMCQYFHLSGVRELMDILEEKNPKALKSLEFNKLDIDGVNPSWLQSTIIEAI